MARGKEAEVVLNFKMTGQVEYAQTVKEINSVMGTAAMEYNRHIAMMGKDGTATAKLTAEQKKLEIQVAGAEKRTRLLREEYAESVKETGEYSKESKKLYNALIQSETGEAKLKTTLEKTNEALEKQGSAAEATAKKMKKIEEAGEKIKGVGKGMTAAVTVPILAIGAAGIKVANDMRQSQTSIQNNLGVTKARAEELQGVAERVWEDGWADSIETAGVALTNVMKQLPQLSKAGDKSIESITKKALILENTMDSDMNETLRGTNGLMTSFGLTGEESMDFIVAATQKGLNKTGELGDNLSEYATLFEENGYSAEEMFAILNAGLDGGAYNLDKVNDLVKEFGVRISDGTIENAVSEMDADWSKLFETWKSGNGTNAELFDMMAIKLGTMNNQQEKQAALSQIWGSMGEDAGFKVIEAMGGATDANGKLVKSYNDVNGASNKMVENAKESVTMQSAWNTMASAAGEVGEIVAPIILSLANHIKSCADWFKNLDDNSKNTILTLFAVAASIGPFLIVLGTLMGSLTKIASGISTVRKAFDLMKLAFATNPFVWIIAGIVALVAGLVYCYVKFKWFRDVVNAIFRSIKMSVSNSFEMIKGVVGSVFDGIVQNFNNFKDAAMRILNGIIDFVTGVFTGNWSQAWQGLVDIFGGIFDGILAAAKAPINGMISLINGFLRGLSNITIPDWVPGIGGKGFSIPEIPMLANGGKILNGQAIVGEAGPELLSSRAGKTTVTPLSPDEKSKGIGGNLKGTTVEQHVHINSINTGSMNELNRMNRNLAKAARLNDIGTGRS